MEPIHVFAETRRMAEDEAALRLEAAGVNPAEWVITAYDTGLGPWLVMFRKRAI